MKIPWWSSTRRARAFTVLYLWDAVYVSGPWNSVPWWIKTAFVLMMFAFALVGLRMGAKVQQRRAEEALARMRLHVANARLNARWN